MKNIEKAAQIIKLLVLDVDGVMTDGSIYLDAEQELFKSFYKRWCDEFYL